MIVELAVRDKWPLDPMFESNCHGETMPRQGIEQETLGLQIRRYQLILDLSTKNLHFVTKI